MVDSEVYFDDVIRFSESLPNHMLFHLSVANADLVRDMLWICPCYLRLYHYENDNTYGMIENTNFQRKKQSKGDYMAHIKDTAR